jgi:hypothetical protein
LRRNVTTREAIKEKNGCNSTTTGAKEQRKGKHSGDCTAVERASSGAK